MSDTLDKPAIYRKGEWEELIGIIFDSLKKINKTKNSKLVIVYLPTKNEYQNTHNDKLHEFVRHQAEKRGILYLDLVKEIRQVSSSEMIKFFFQKDIKGFEQSKGHLTPMGNFFVAKKISQVLAGIDSPTTQ